MESRGSLQPRLPKALPLLLLLRNTSAPAYRGEKTGKRERVPRNDGERSGLHISARVGCTGRSEGVCENRGTRVCENGGERG
eukprot:699166-Rhodomonas_salina.1